MTPTTGKTIIRTCYLEGRQLMDYQSGRRLRLATFAERLASEISLARAPDGAFEATISLRTYRRATDQLAVELVADHAQGVGLGAAIAAAGWPIPW